MSYNYIELKDGVNSYSKREVGSYFFTIDDRVSNFQVREFACHDERIVPGGTDEIKIDGGLVRNLQIFRDRFGITTSNSAYRTEKWNEIVGGTPKSQHVQGRASDTVCKNASPLEVAMYAEALGMGGIGLYDTFTHVDTRTENIARWKDTRDTGNKQVGVTTFLKTIKMFSRGNEVRIAQKYLGVAVDGVFGKDTKKATIIFQNKEGLKEDGIIGPKTWVKLLTQ